MNKKKLIALASIAIIANGFVIAKNDIAAMLTNDDDMIFTPSTIPQQEDIFLKNDDEGVDGVESSLEQRFMCKQDEKDESVVCQMYECLNDECQISEPVQFTENESSKTFTLTGKPLVTQEEETSATTEANQQEEPMWNEFQESILELSTPNTTPSQPDQDEITTKDVMPGLAPVDATAETDDVDLGFEVDVPSNVDARIHQLAQEITIAEKKCERAESDPREKAVCERASAAVQWRKEEIRRLEHLPSR